MDAPKSTPLWLHILRLFVLGVAAAGVAWVVTSAHRRAMKARPAERDSTHPLDPELAVVPEEEDPDDPAATAGLDTIEVPVTRSSLPQLRLEPPGLTRQPAPQVKVPFPDLTLEIGWDLTLALPEVPLLPVEDRYIGSSKSAVFRPETFTPAQPRQRHGKP